MGRAWAERDEVFRLQRKRGRISLAWPHGPGKFVSKSKATSKRSRTETWL